MAKIADKEGHFEAENEKGSVDRYKLYDTYEEDGDTLILAKLDSYIGIKNPLWQIFRLKKGLFKNKYIIIPNGSEAYTLYYLRFQNKGSIK